MFPEEKSFKMDLKVSGFQLLPNDLILKIFTYVSIRDLGNCAQLSKNLRLIANDKELWIKFLFIRGQIPDGFVEYVLSKGKVIRPKYYKNSIESYNLLCRGPSTKMNCLYIVSSTKVIYTKYSKLFKWNSYFYVSGQSRPSWAALKLL